VIGNDLESLDLWPKRSVNRRLRFRKKVFTPFELEWLQRQSSADHAEVVLWCAKESVYKAWHRLTSERKFAPKDFEIHPREVYLMSSSLYKCEMADYSFHGKWWTKSGVVHSIAALQDIPLDSLSYQIGNKGLRTKYLEKSFKDERGCLWVEGDGKLWPISRSHSDRLTAELTHEVGSYKL
jgi:phosphopantetheinyl transferase (holo-ACP synthase)